MSLGLGDLKKKRRPSSKSQTQSPPATPTSLSNTNNWSSRTRMARPWSDHGLNRPSRSRPLATESAMSSEWLETYTAPSLASDFFNESPLLRIQAELSEIETRAREAVEAHLVSIRSFLGLKV